MGRSGYDTSSMGMSSNPRKASTKLDCDDRRTSYPSIALGNNKQGNPQKKPKGEHSKDPQSKHQVMSLEEVNAGSRS